MRLYEIPAFLVWTAAAVLLWAFVVDGALKLWRDGWPPNWQDVNGLAACTVLGAAGTWRLIGRARGKEDVFDD